MGSFPGQRILAIVVSPYPAWGESGCGFKLVWSKIWNLFLHPRWICKGKVP